MSELPKIAVSGQAQGCCVLGLPRGITQRPLGSRVARSQCPCGSAWAWCHLSWAASADPVYKTGMSRIPTSRLRSYRGASLRSLSSKSVAFWKVQAMEAGKGSGAAGLAGGEGGKAAPCCQ